MLRQVPGLLCHNSTKVAKSKPFARVGREIASVREHISSLVSKAENPILHHAASYVLQGQGKLLRPALVSLMSHAVVPLAASEAFLANPIGDLDDVSVHPAGAGHPIPHIRRFLRLAEVTELIHTASLVHDDVIDNSPTRRGRPALHVDQGIKNAVLAGDFLLARASYWIATLETPEIVILMTKALENLTEGEILQAEGCFDIPTYETKSYCKTASLIDHSLASTAVLAAWGFPNSVSDNREYVAAASSYGRHLGIAFQIVDDCLDITGSEENLGKPKLADMREGIATLPVLLAAQVDARVDAAMRRRFAAEGDVQLCVESLERNGSVTKALELADGHCRQAIAALQALHPSPARDSLEEAVNVVLTRQA
jgi:geranylgeranyl pyrophosphate synthase